MNFLTGTLLILALLTSLWMLTWHRHWAHHSIEQVQLQASLSSVCHQSRELLNSELRNSNIAIEGVRGLMTAMATACISAALASAWKGGFAASMQVCNQQLRAPARLGKLLQRAQGSAITIGLPTMNWLRLQEMIRYNQLKAPHIQKAQLPRWSASALSAEASQAPKGFVRKNLNDAERFLESFVSRFGDEIKWPEDLVADQSLSEERVLSNQRRKTQFEAQYTYALKYRPPAFGYTQDNKSSPLLRKLLSAKENSLTQSATFCFLKEESAGRRYRVQLDAPR